MIFPSVFIKSNSSYKDEPTCVLAFGTQGRVFKPGRSRRIFQGGKNPQHAFLRNGSKAVCPMSHICGL